MISFYFCIALLNLGLGYYLGIRYGSLLPLAANFALPKTAVSTLNQQVHAEAPAAEAAISSEVSPATESSTDVEAVRGSNQRKTEPVLKRGWNTSGPDLAGDLGTMQDRIRYASSADDKQLARDVAAELRTRSQNWQRQLEELLGAIDAEMELNPGAKLDAGTTELCLAQIETMQTNIALLEWSESTDHLMAKLLKEVEAVKRLLPENNESVSF